MDANSERYGAAGITLRLAHLSPMARRFLKEVSTPVSGWSSRERPLPTRAVATWHLPGGDFEYVDVPSLSEGIAFNLPPGI